MSRGEKKEYAVTSAVRYAFQKAKAMRELRDLYIFEDNHKMAVDCTLEATILSDKAWKMVYDLHPELEGKAITFKHHKKIIVIGD